MDKGGSRLCELDDAEAEEKRREVTTLTAQLCEETMQLREWLIFVSVIVSTSHLEISVEYKLSMATQVPKHNMWEVIIHV